MTARERARKAAFDKWNAAEISGPRDCADAASDIWEEYLREVLYLTENDTLVDIKAYVREVLGDG